MEFTNRNKEIFALDWSIKREIAERIQDGATYVTCVM